MNERKEPKDEINTEELTEFKITIDNYVWDEINRERKTTHFLKMKGETREFDANDLTGEDMEIWKKVSNNSLTREDFFVYRSSVDKFIESNPGKKEAYSRKVFAAFIANKASIIFNQRELEEKDKKQK